jgi:hypothetical protein
LKSGKYLGKKKPQHAAVLFKAKAYYQFLASGNTVILDSPCS